MRETADAFLNNGCAALKIRKYYAQALLDLGHLAAAEDVLMHLKNDADAGFRDANKQPDERTAAEKEWAEACGLLGRLYKDRFVNAHAPNVTRNKTALNLAIAHYYDCYTADKGKMQERHWHGINAVALARLAKRHDVRVTRKFDVQRTAKTILEEVKVFRRLSDQPIDVWAAAIAMEASIALEDWDGAYTWAREVRGSCSLLRS